MFAEYGNFSQDTEIFSWGAQVWSLLLECSVRVRGVFLNTIWVGGVSYIQFFLDFLNGT